MSKVLYVDLVNPSGEVVKSEKLKIVDGEADGYIDLRHLLVSGFYEIRAYTSYMLNWGTTALFSRVFPILEKPAAEGDYNDRRMDEFGARNRLPDYREKEEEGRKAMNVTFYPEGGHLISGLENRIAFAVTDEDGAHFETEGYLEAGGRRLCDVRTLREGRGVFTCTPGAERLTLHLANAKGGERSFRLPEAEQEGCVICADVTDADAITVDILASPKYRGQKMGLITMHGGQVKRFDELASIGLGKRIIISKAELGNGVSQVALIDSVGRMMANRMVFVCQNPSVKRIDLQLRNEYLKPYGKISLTAKAVPNCRFSLAVRDYHSQVDGWQADLASWLLLSSDLKGYIENAKYYVEADDEEHRRAADLLMMVQGWKRYDFQMMEGKKTFEMNHSLEDKLYIDGKLNQYKRKKTVDGVKMGMVLTNNLGDQLAGQTVTGAKGHYAFALPDCYRNWDVTLMTMKDDKFERYYVGINRHFSPERRQLEALELDPVEMKEPMLKITTTDTDDQKWKSDEVQILQEVKVTGKMWRNPRDFWERESRGAKNATLWYDCGLEADNLLDQGLSVPTLIDFLKQKNPLFSGNDNLSGGISYQDYRYNLYDDGPSYARRPIIWVVNNNFFCATGMPASNVKQPKEGEQPMEKTISFPSQLDEVKKVYISMEKNDLRRFAPYLNTIGKNCVIVYVYSYNLLPVKPVKGIRMTHFEGFNVPKEYEEEMVTGLLPAEDHRRTLYWNPDVSTNAEGKATIEFLNRPGCKMMNVSAEGISKDGSPMICR